MSAAWQVYNIHIVNFIDRRRLTIQNTKKRILVVDDEHDIILILQLEKWFDPAVEEFINKEIIPTIKENK